MLLSHAFILGALQGLTEFIPISSTAHLFLAQRTLGLENGPELLVFDLVLHLGTLVALIAFTWREIAGMVREFFRWIARKPARDPANRALILPIVIGTVPGALVGLFFLDHIAEARSLALVGAAMLAACAYFLLAESIAGRRPRAATAASALDGLWIGLAQAAAGIFAGLSRSGLTIATGTLRGLSRESAARFSFLLSVPIILGAGVSALLDLDRALAADISAAALLTGFLASAVFGGIAIGFLLRFLRTHTLRPFAAYLGVLGLILLTAPFWL